MLNINFASDSNGAHHKCESIREGDWIIFSCAKCPDYERRLNWRTGKMTSSGTKDDVHHTGSYFPHEYRDAFENVN